MYIRTQRALAVGVSDSRKLAETIISNVCSNKIPLHSHSRTLECMVRLSDDKEYIDDYYILNY